MRVGGLSAEVTSLTLHQLQPETVYEFTVLARNRLGDGLFSDVIRARTKGQSVLKHFLNGTKQSIARRNDMLPPMAVLRGHIDGAAT